MSPNGGETRPGPRSDVPLAERDPKDTTLIILRALREPNLELILAHSPQAKGRVGRSRATSETVWYPGPGSSYSRVSVP